MIPDGNHSTAMDSALRELGRATPPAGMEGRILNRLAEQRMATDAKPSWGVWPGGLRSRMPKASLRALGWVSACLVCAMMVAGSVRYSHRGRSGQVVVPAVLQAPGQGIGAASAVHPAAPASHPVAAGPTSRGRTARHAQQQGRARVARHARTAPGVIVPVPAAPPQK